MSKPAREGLQTEAVTYAWVQMTPSLASWSIRGVLKSLVPVNPKSIYPASSAKRMTIFGFAIAAEDKKDVRAKIIACFNIYMRCIVRINE